MSKKCYYKVWDRRCMNFWPRLFTNKRLAWLYVDNEIQIPRRFVRLVNLNELGLFEEKSPYLKYMLVDTLGYGYTRRVVHPIADSKTA